MDRRELVELRAQWCWSGWQQMKAQPVHPRAGDLLVAREALLVVVVEVADDVVASAVGPSEHGGRRDSMARSHSSMRGQLCVVVHVHRPADDDAQHGVSTAQLYAWAQPPTWRHHAAPTVPAAGASSTVALLAGCLSYGAGG